MIDACLLLGNRAIDQAELVISLLYAAYADISFADISELWFRSLPSKIWERRLRHRAEFFIVSALYNIGPVTSPLSGKAIPSTFDDGSRSRVGGNNPQASVQAT